MLIGVDGSPGARRAVAFVERLEAPHGGSVTLFTAVEQTVLPAQALATPAIRAAVPDARLRILGGVESARERDDPL